MIVLWAPSGVCRGGALSFIRWIFDVKLGLSTRREIILCDVLYWGLFNYFGNGRTPGKWIARTQAVSLTSERMGLWQSFERGVGYGAAVLEGGVGFLQYFWDKNRMCAQDRLAETIVVDQAEAGVSGA